MAAASLRVQPFRAVASPARAPVRSRRSLTVFARKTAAKAAYICIDCEYQVADHTGLSYMISNLHTLISNTIGTLLSR